MSLRLKVNLFFAILLVTSLLASTGALISNARQSVKTEVEDAMASAARLIMVSLGTTINRNIGVYDHLQDMIKELSKIRSLNILLFDSERLLFEGEPKAAELAFPPAWFIKLLSPDVKPLSKQFGNGRIVIYPAPIHEISETWLDIRDILVLGIAIFILVGLLLYQGVGRLLKPLEHVLTALAGFERGDLYLRLPRFSLMEMDRIGQMFNRMGRNLELSIEENSRLAVLVQQAGDAILSLDHTGHISFFNNAAEQLFSEYSTNLLGEELANLGFISRRQKIADIVEKCDTVDNLEVELMQSDQVISLLFSTVPLIDVNKVVRGVICTLRDITEHKKAEIAATKLHESRLLAQHITDAQDAERRHLAQELHDELGQCLTAIKTDAVLIRNRIAKSEPKVFSSAQAIIDVASHIYDLVHNMITRLRPSPLDDLGLLSTLQQTVTEWQQRQPDIKFDLIVSGLLDNLNETINMTVFRVVQESITNAVRHADASYISISVANEQKGEQGHQLAIDICDDGKGMQVEDFHADVDFGLLGMRERTHSLGGRFQLESTPGTGLAIHITLPLTDEEQHGH